jgi:hypothetical protein
MISLDRVLDSRVINSKPEHHHPPKIRAQTPAKYWNRMSYSSRECRSYSRSSWPSRPLAVAIIRALIAGFAPQVSNFSTNSHGQPYLNDIHLNESHNRGKQVEGQVLAYLAEEESERALAELPGQAVVGELRTWVPKTCLLPHEGA